MNIDTPLDIHEIDFRVQSINKGGYATILAYKDARVDMNRLDAIYGVDGWQKEYKEIKGRLYCRVGIYSERLNQWVWKEDVGTESAAEAVKGEASDSFKRACFNLGIGRVVYDYPVIQVNLIQDEWEMQNNKPKQTWNLKLKEWLWYAEFTDGKINFLAARDNNQQTRFTWGTMKPKGE